MRIPYMRCPKTICMIAMINIVAMVVAAITKIPLVAFMGIFSNIAFFAYYLPLHGYREVTASMAGLLAWNIFIAATGVRPFG